MLLLQLVGAANMPGKRAFAIKVAQEKKAHTVRFYKWLKLKVRPCLLLGLRCLWCCAQRQQLWAGDLCWVQDVGIIVCVYVHMEHTQLLSAPGFFLSCLLHAMTLNVFRELLQQKTGHTMPGLS